MHGEGHLHTSPASGRETELDSGRRVESSEGQIWLDALPRDFPGRQLGPLEVNLFASRLSTQLPTFVSWRPDPEAMTTDAFTMSWSGLKAYANPPWSLVGRVLAQAQQQQADLVLIAPGSMEILTLVPSSAGDVRVPPQVASGSGRSSPASTHSIDAMPQLAVWSISGRGTRSNSFRRKLWNSCSHPGEGNPPKHASRNSRNGLAGVVQGVSIPFIAL